MGPVDVPVLPILQTRTCGSCTLCCKLVAVSELQKPAGIWCKHCAPGIGCSIHATSEYQSSCYHACRSYKCLWLKVLDIPNEFRPDRIHAVFSSMTTGLVIHLDPCNHDIWRSGLIWKFIMFVFEGGEEQVSITWGEGADNGIVLSKQARTLSEQMRRRI